MVVMLTSTVYHKFKLAGLHATAAHRHVSHDCHLDFAIVERDHRVHRIVIARNRFIHLQIHTTLRPRMNGLAAINRLS